MVDRPQDLPPDPAAGDAYALFARGAELIDQRHWAQAALSLEQAIKLEPGKTSILEALGRAYFHMQRYEQAAEAFREVIDQRPDDDFSQFCLGRSLEKLGDLTGAARHMALAVGMRPGRDDYRHHLQRLRDRS
ncbi:MAG: tetratricopeptide repeat protein [Actinobacteria bacterium]|nr:tetratricopeptide repeat protein [Actinomycetota bacterium]